MSILQARPILAFLALICIAFLSTCSNSQNTETLPAPTSTLPIPTPTFSVSHYAFPDPIDPSARYLFYVHGKIVEDQGVPAVSPDFGEYKYLEILERLSSYGFTVISEQRSKNADVIEYAERVKNQVTTLLDAGVPAKNITVVGVSKGASIVVYISHLVGNPDVNYVIMAICHPDIVQAYLQGNIFLTGNVLSIYDSVDEYAGSCHKLFAFSEGKGLSKHEEIVLQIGTGHGILYQPLGEWVNPVIQWAKNP